MSKSFTPAQVAEHKDPGNGLYIIVDENVYDVTGTSFPPFSLSRSRWGFGDMGYGRGGQYSHVMDRRRKERKKERKKERGKLTHTLPLAEFINEHPGGAKILKRVAGKDATKQFWKYHNEGVLKKYSPKLKVGTVAETAKL